MIGSPDSSDTLPDTVTCADAPKVRSTSVKVKNNLCNMLLFIVYSINVIVEVQPPFNTKAFQYSKLQDPSQDKNHQRSGRHGASHWHHYKEQ